MNEERRQEQRRNDVTPVENPVEEIEPARERKCQRAEERHAQPEEVQRRLVFRAAQPHAGPDEQREESDARQRQIEPLRSRGNAGNGNDEDVRVGQAGNHVLQRLSGPRRVQHVLHIAEVNNRLRIDLEEDVAGLDPGTACRCAFGDNTGRDFAAVRDPQNAIFHLVPATERDVHRGENDEPNDHGKLSHKAQQSRFVHGRAEFYRRHRRVRLLQSKRRSLFDVDG